ncbi:MAG: hypothetical protein KDC53_06955, partial [Saprospiraceae bacterium]|nr:hypothetical protein [Saprospiraceae bacterium]
AKHFKNYYLIGALVLGGVGLYALYILFERKFLKSLLVGLSIFFSIHTIYNLVTSLRFKKEILTTRLQDQNGLRQAMQKADFLLFKPEWMWGPSPDYGLIFGLSYVRHRDRYKEIIHGIKPEVLTFEGNDRSLMNMRVLNIPDTALVDKTIVTVDQSVRPAKEILDFLHARLEIIGVDSIYGTPETPIICIRTGKSISPIQ